jgi:hypothetical protein
MQLCQSGQQQGQVLLYNLPRIQVRVGAHKLHVQLCQLQGKREVQVLLYNLPRIQVRVRGHRVQFTRLMMPPAVR